MSTGTELSARPPGHPWVKPWCPPEEPPCVVVAHRGRAPLHQMWPDAVFARATAAKYWIISSEHLRAAGSATVLWAQKCKSFAVKIWLSGSQEWLH